MRLEDAVGLRVAGLGFELWAVPGLRDSRLDLLGESTPFASLGTTTVQNVPPFWASAKGACLVSWCRTRAQGSCS